MKIVLILITILITLSGCAEKLVFIKSPCINMSPIIQPEHQEIRVHREDGNLYDAYIDEFRGKIDNQNQLINKMNSTCDKWSLKND